ncbi:MAG: aldo/keto reductase [Parachlamydiales bacterium]|nr:aldo/keto reductase [Parachlamydiales bacterium]
MLKIATTLNNGIEIPLLGFGTWLLEGKTCTEAVSRAIELGYRHIDTACIYHNHLQVAEGIKNIKRNELFITTKLWLDQLDLGSVETACDEALQQLNTEYIDLLLVHWPDKTKCWKKILEKMQILKEKKKIRSIGVSNCTIHHLQDILDQGMMVSVNQVEFHPYLYQKDLLDFCSRHHILITAYSPLARGRVFKDPQMIEIGKKYYKTPGQIALRWLIEKGIAVIPKGTSKTHIQENFDVFDFSLEKADTEKIDFLCKSHGKRIIKPPFHEFNY